MADWDDAAPVEVVDAPVAAAPLLDTQEIKVFNKWSLSDVEVSDISLVDYIAVKEKGAKYLPHTAGRYQVKRFRKANIVKQSIFIMLIYINFFTGASALYSSNDDVVELTSGNFKKQVLDSDSVWIVEFYAPWCDHCKSLTPEYKKAATALKGIAKVGAVDMTQHQSVGGPYNVQGFPTIKIFAGDKNKPTDFNGARTAETLVNTVRTIIENLFDSRLNGEKSGSGSSSSSGGGKRGSGNDVVELTDSNFEEMVLKSKDLWLLIFYGCSSFTEAENEWEAAASDLKGKVRLGAVDATVHTVIAGKFNIRGEGVYTLMFFIKGKQWFHPCSWDDEDSCNRHDIVTWASAKAVENLPPPELKQAMSRATFDEACKDKQLCIIAVLPHILDCQSKCRNNYIKTLQSLADKFKKNVWGWIWTEAGQQAAMEESFGIGGFGYPAMVAVNSRKLKYSTMTGSFGKDGISEFLRDLSYGKGKTSSIRGSEFPNIISVDVCLLNTENGKDGVPPQTDDIDLSDVELDDLDKPEL